MKMSLVAQDFSPFQVISIPRDFNLKNSLFYFDLYRIVVIFSTTVCILVVITNTLVQI